jgi:RNA polymerase sigma-70 factor (sigma-E family)
MHADADLLWVGEPGSGPIGLDIGGRVAASDASENGAGAMGPGAIEPGAVEPGAIETGPIETGPIETGAMGTGAGDAAIEHGPGGFDDFYRSHYQSLVRLGFLLTLSEEVARDLVHDVFVRVYGRFDGLDDPLPYLRRSVVNASRSWHRRRRLERAQAHATPHVPDAVLEADELFDVLARLPSRQRAAIVLRFYEQMSDAEIAALLHCRPGTVASLVHRGCARLRTAISDPQEERS